MAGGFVGELSPESPLISSPAKEDNIFSAGIHKITSQDMQGVREAILLAQQQQLELQADLKAIEQEIIRNKRKIQVSYLLLYGFFYKPFIQRVRDEIQVQQAVAKQVQEKMNGSVVELEVEFDREFSEQYRQVIDSFRHLMESQKIWDVTSVHYQDRVAARSSASALVNRREVRFRMQPLPFIRSQTEVLYFRNANGADLYFYPGFIVMHVSKDKFALIGANELLLDFTAIRFTETESVPIDAKVVDQTWAKVNKNGTPDKRFKENYQIPVVLYGELSLTTATGLQEQYQFSSYEASRDFWQAFRTYQASVRQITR